MLAIFALSLALATQASAQVDNCLLIKGGPSEDAKWAAAAWMKENYIQGEVCLEGCSVLDDELDEALSSMAEGRTGCVANVESQYLNVAFGNQEDFDGGGEDECENVC
ncbi:hypothetical protein FZEAL_3728 [Fusarium zealandicum]|uniref:Uncharacterized protein n=1 Tax=Fusarium zealandicum TaxID=1053134 RepID=A0A8H4UNM6_9HYPO|nr:hypothetical protein FZEAL_3728 [Fusarium zealandicum]